MNGITLPESCSSYPNLLVYVANRTLTLYHVKNLACYSKAQYTLVEYL